MHFTYASNFHTLCLTRPGVYWLVWYNHDFIFSRYSDNQSQVKDTYATGICICTVSDIIDRFFRSAIPHLTSHDAYVKFEFATRIFYTGVLCLATDGPCSIYCRGLTTCLLNVSPFFRCLVLVLNNSWSAILTEQMFAIVFLLFIYTCPYLCIYIYLLLSRNFSVP